MEEVKALHPPLRGHKKLFRVESDKTDNEMTDSILGRFQHPDAIRLLLGEVC